MAIVGALPGTAAEATDLAEKLVADLLPPSLQAWLQGMEHQQLVAASVGATWPMAPERTAALTQAVSLSVRSLTELLAPARQRGPELEVQVLKMFAAFNLYTGDQSKLNAMTAVWAEELEEFPMYAIRKAGKWAMRSGDKLPSLASFIRDVRLAMGANVVTRLQLLQKWLEGAA